MGKNLNFLEAVGLNTILDGDLDSLFEPASFVGGALFIFGVVGWLLLALFKPSLLNQCTTVSCLIPGIIILIIFIRNIVKSIKGKDKRLIVYDAISLILIIIAFIKGFIVPYHSIQYHYEYKGIWSAIATTTWLTVAITFIRYFVSRGAYDWEDAEHYDKASFFDKVKNAFIYLAIVLGLYIFFIVVGQGSALIISLTGHDDIYDHFIRYKNEVILERMKDFKYESVEACLNEKIPEIIKNHIDKEIERNKNKGSYDEEDYERIVRVTHDSYTPNGDSCLASDNPGHLSLDNNISYYFYKDKLTQTEEYYYSFDYNSMSLSKITKEEYDSHRKKY